VPRAELACGRAGDDGDGMATQLVRPALRLLSGSTACTAANCCICMVWGVVLPRASVVVLAPWARAVCHGPRTNRSQSEVVSGGDFSCEAKACRARRRLVVRGGDLSEGIPLVGSWSEMQPTGQRLDVLPVWVLTRALSLPRPESWPSTSSILDFVLQWCWVTLCLRKIFSPLNGALIRALVSSYRA
jgi:hypothetical protein